MAVNFPDLSNLDIRNPNEYDCKRCGLDHHNSEPGQCWNVSAQPYLNTYNTWINTGYSQLINEFQQYQQQGNYSAGSQLANSAFNWAQQSLSALQVHIGWIQHMKSNWTLDRRCCVSRTGGDNFNNQYIPVQDELKAKLEAFRDEMQEYIFQFQGVPPSDAVTATGQEDEQGGYTSQFGSGTSGNQFGEQATSQQQAGADDSANLTKFLIAGGVVLVVLTGLVFFLRRK